MSEESLVSGSRQTATLDPYLGPPTGPFPYARPPRPSRVATAGRYVREILRKLWLVALIAGLAGGAAFALRLDAADTYESVAVVRISVSEQFGDDGSITAFQSEQIAELVLTPSSMSDAAARAGLDISAAEAQRRIGIELRTTPGFLDVIAQGPDPAAAQSLAQGTAEVMAASASLDTSPTISVIEPAVLPKDPVPTTEVRDAILAAIIGALVAAAGVIVLRKLRGRVSPVSPEIEIGRLSGLPTINLNTKNETDRALAPFFAVHLYGSRVITVLQRGKSPTVELASALAVAAVSFNRRTMVIDADASKPVLHSRFGHPQAPGLADVLAGRQPLRRVVRRASENNPIAILSAGSADAELLGIERIIGTQQIVDASGADCTILSSTANSSLHESLLLAHHFPQSVLLTLNPRHTTVGEIEQLTDRVRSVGGRVAGIVLHDGRSLDGPRMNRRRRKVERRDHMKRQVARDWSER